jgi:hypothetical protein
MREIREFKLVLWGHLPCFGDVVNTCITHGLFLFSLLIFRKHKLEGSKGQEFHIYQINNLQMVQYLSHFSISQMDVIC